MRDSLSSRLPVQGRSFLAVLLPCGCMSLFDSEASQRDDTPAYWRFDSIFRLGINQFVTKAKIFSGWEVLPKSQPRPQGNDSITPSEHEAMNRLRGFRPSPEGWVMPKMLMKAFDQEAEGIHWSSILVFRCPQGAAGCED